MSQSDKLRVIKKNSLLYNIVFKQILNLKNYDLTYKRHIKFLLIKRFLYLLITHKLIGLNKLNKNNCKKHLSMRLSKLYKTFKY